MIRDSDRKEMTRLRGVSVDSRQRTEEGLRGTNIETVTQKDRQTVSYL